MSVTDEVLQLIELSRQHTNTMTDRQVIAITKAWVEAWDELEPELVDAVLGVFADDVNKTISPDRLARADRLAKAMEQAEQRLTQLGARAEQLVINDLGATIVDAANQHVAALQAQLPDDAAGIRLGWINQTEVDAIVARASQTIHSNYLKLPDDVAAMMKAELIKSVVVGDNPRTTAEWIIDKAGDRFYGGLSRATMIARTEMMDAHRAADLASAQLNTHIIDGWEWMATLDARTCGACLSMHGQRFPKEQFGPEGHHQCRCTRVDVTKSWAELGFKNIPDTTINLQNQRDAWWDNLTEDTKRRILGPGKYELFSEQRINWDDLATRTNISGWRAGYFETPLKNLQN